MDNAEQPPWRLIVGPLVKVYADCIIVDSRVGRITAGYTATRERTPTYCEEDDMATTKVTAP
jgi:hypothetical protein